IAALAPLAARLAETGDEGAAAIVEQAAEELARHVPYIARLAGADLPWSYAGGGFKSRAPPGALARRLARPPPAPRPSPPWGGRGLPSPSTSSGRGPLPGSSASGPRSRPPRPRTASSNQQQGEQGHAQILPIHRCHGGTRRFPASARR